MGPFRVRGGFLGRAQRRAGPEPKRRQNTYLTHTTTLVLVLSLLLVLPLFRFTFHALVVLLDTELADAQAPTQVGIRREDGIPATFAPGRSPG